MLDDRKERAISLLIQGEQITNIAKSMGLSRTTIYNWMMDDEFRNELGKREQEIKTQGNRMILNKLNSCIDELLSIALSGDSEKVRSDTAQYLVDRVLGKPTSKIEQSAEQNENNVSKDLVLDAIEDKDEESKE